MNNLKKDFLKRTVSGLEDLTARERSSGTLSSEFWRETARTLHTIKGTSQTFGFSRAAKFAHELENLLGAKGSNNSQQLLLQGLETLAKIFRQTVDEAEYENIEAQIHRIKGSSKPQALFLRKIPNDIAKQLSTHEKQAFSRAIADEKEIFCLRMHFGLNGKMTEYKQFLSDCGSLAEKLAMIPAPIEETSEQNGFLIYFATNDAAKLSEIVRNFSADITLEPLFVENDPNDLFDELKTHAKNLAAMSGKKIDIAVSAEKIELSDETRSLIFDILVHLIRNAVDHGIESPDERSAKNKTSKGTIAIALKSEENGLKISVKDDGKGVDIEKLRAKVVGNDLVPDAENLTENELLDLIFLPDFSTAETVTEISGRGVGLDAVKTLVGNAGGTIGVKSVVDSGTNFEIVLPMKSGSLKGNQRV